MLVRTFAVTFIAVMLGLLCVQSFAQDTTELFRLQAIRDAAQQAYDVERQNVIKENAEAISGVKLGVDPVAIARMQADIDALKAALDAQKAAAQTALQELQRTDITLTLSRLRAILVPALGVAAK